MKSTNLSPDDPRLTAFALGELDHVEHAAVAAAVAADPALQAAVAEVRALAGELTGALASEPEPVAEPLNPPTPAPVGNEALPEPAGKVVRFPYYWITGLAAAAFAVLVAVRDEESPLVPTTRVYELDLHSPAEATSEAERQAAAEREESAQKRMAEARQMQSADSLVTNDALQQFAPMAAHEAPDSSKARTQFGMGAVKAEPAPAPYLSAASRAGTLGVHESVFPPPPPRTQPFNTEGYAVIDENPFLPAAGNPLSTFAVDVDTGSYANVRRLLNQRARPPTDAVRIEELLNYFPYTYSGPSAEDETPFAAHLEVASAPWAPEHRLVRIGLKAREIAGARAAANLVFLLDVSGSMAQPNKLPLVKEAMRQLVQRLHPDDRVAIVTYAGNSGLALPSTPAARSQDILSALKALTPGGSTNGAMGIQLAYDIAKANFVTGGINRVILCTDGDFNVGVTSTGDLTQLVAEKARSGVYLTALGFGTGNIRDDTLERLADRGNGNYGYIDSPKEARKLLVEQVDGTLVTVAKDVKVQVEFNPAQVQAYRLIGYENRMLRQEEFNDDTVDAGEIGAGHTVTALYEVIPTGVAWEGRTNVDPLKYQQVDAIEADDKAPRAAPSPELLTVKLRYKAPDSDTSRRVEFPLVDRGTSFAEASADFRFAAAVAGFGMSLRESPHRGSTTLAHVAEWASGALGNDAGGYRREFVSLVHRAIAIGYN